MCKIGGNTTLAQTLEDEYQAEDITPFICGKNYDETLSTIHAAKSYRLNGEQHVQQQIEDRQGTNRILLVDDEVDINLTIKLVLEGSGFKIDSFTDPLLALDSFKRGLYDLVILDVKMPIMNGFGLYQEIQKIG